MSVMSINDLVRVGRVTPAQGAMLLQLRAEIQWRRRPWWERLAIVLGRMVFS